MFNLMDYKQGEEIKDRLDRLEKKMDRILKYIVEADRDVILHVPPSLPFVKPTPKKKGK